MKNLSFLLLSILFLSSCSKDLESISETFILKEEVILDDELDINSLVTFNSNYASFDSPEDFDKFLVKLYELSEADLNEFSSNISFTTIYEYLDDLYDQLDEIEDESEFKAFVNQHDDYLAIIEDEYGELEVVEKDMFIAPIRVLQNKDRIVKVGDDFVKFIGNLYVLSNDYGTLSNLKSVADVNNSDFDFKVAYTTFDVDASQRELNRIKSIQIEKDVRGCRKDRRVEFSWVVGRQETSFSGSPVDVTFFVATTIKPTKKGRPCIWYRYKTRITRNNFNFQGDIMLNSVLAATWNIVREDTEVEARRLDTDEAFFSYFPLFPTTEQAFWTRERVDVTTRGMDGMWINLDN